MRIYGLLFVCLFVLQFCVFVRLRISSPRTKIAASNFARWFIGVLGRESHILENLLPQKPKIGRIGSYESPASPAPWLPSACIRAGQPWRGRRRPRVGSACVDIRSSPKTEYLFLFIYIFIYDEGGQRTRRSLTCRKTV